MRPLYVTELNSPARFKGLTHLHITEHLTAWADSASKRIAQRIGFWSGGLYELQRGRALDAREAPASKDVRKWVLVVGRSHYFETVRDYPIANFNDLKKILKNEPWRFPYTGTLLQRIVRISNDVHRVTSWVVKTGVIESFVKKPFLVVPESACLEHLTQRSTVQLARLGKVLFAAQSPDGVISSLGNRDAFFRAAGLPELSDDSSDRDMLTFAGADAVDALIQGVTEAIRSAPLAFFIGIDYDKLKLYAWKPALKTSLLLCLGYFLATSIYLLAATGMVGYQLEGKRAKAESALLVRDEVAGYRRRLADGEAVTDNIYPMWVAWDLMIDLRATGAELRAVNSQPPEVTFYITAERATEVLAWFGEDPRVSAAEFAVAVADFNGREQFAVRVTVEDSFAKRPPPLEAASIEPDQNSLQRSQQLEEGIDDQ